MPLDNCTCGHSANQHMRDGSFLPTSCKVCHCQQWNAPDNIKESQMDGKLLKQGIKHDQGKLRYDLLPFGALDDVVKVFTFGAIKYEDRNWEKGINYSRLIAATFRHFTSWLLGNIRDKETNINHLAHAITCLMFLLHFEQYPDKYKQFDDRARYY